MAPAMYLDYDEEACPDYNVAVSVSRSKTATSSSSCDTSSDAHWPAPLEYPARSTSLVRSLSAHAPSPLRRLPTPNPKTPTTPRAPSFTSPTSPPPPVPVPKIRPERYVYAYTMTAAGAPLKFLISVEPVHGRPTRGKYAFRLSLKVNDVERSLCDTVFLQLSVDPRTLDFSVFLFPGKKNVFPAGCLFSLRIWLRVNGVDHRIFGDDDLWVAKDPDFNSVEVAVFARLRNVTHGMQVYDALVGRARVQFFVRWHHLGGRLYKYSVDYEAGGVGAVLIEDLRLLVEGDPRRLTFHIYAVSLRSVPAGASHRLRIWLRSFVGPLTGIANGDETGSMVAQLLDSSYVYQRIWKTDAFKVGGRLDFDALGPKVIMARSGYTGVGGAPIPQTVISDGWDLHCAPLQPPSAGRPMSPLPEGYQEETKAQLLEL